MTRRGNHATSDGPDQGRALEFGFFLDPAAKEPAVRATAAATLDLRSGGRAKARALSPGDAVTQQRQLT
jgi:hypothetical protein